MADHAAGSAAGPMLPAGSAADESGWASSAAAWIAAQGASGDRSRRNILDRPMLAEARTSGANGAVDDGCGEGRFCRMRTAGGIAATGLDQTPARPDRAWALDPAGCSVLGRAEVLPFSDARFGPVVSDLTRIDVPDDRTAISEMVRVLAPGGTQLVATASPCVTAIPLDLSEGESGRVKVADGTRRRVALDDDTDERPHWNGSRIVNHHRPRSTLKAAFLGADLGLIAKDAPPETGSDPAEAETVRPLPWFALMVWRRG